MANERIRSDENLPPQTRAASKRLGAVLTAANKLSQVPAPAGQGAGAEVIAREVKELRERIQQLTSGTETLDQQLRSPYRLLVVGPSTAGKSTLINVLAGAKVLPTSGVGDAKTLKETVLVYSNENHRVLRIRYIGRQEVQRRRFTLEAYARKQPGLREEFKTPWNNEDIGAADADEHAPDLSTDAAGQETEVVKRELDRRYATLVMQIKTLVYPECRHPEKFEALSPKDKESLTSATVADWVDAWCLLQGKLPVAGNRFGQLWGPRLAEACELLGRSVDIRESDHGDKEFIRAVERHTSEGLAFLVDRVELALPSSDLEQMDVEDLPGVGNFQDPASDVARDVLAKAMRERDLDGLLVVVKQNGIAEDVVNLLEEAAVLRRVLQGQTDLAVAVTHIDGIAAAQAQDLESQGLSDDEFPSNNQLLRQASTAVAVPQLSRLKTLLEAQVAELDVAEQTARVTEVLGRTHVVGVEASAAEAYLFGLNRKIQQAFATDYEGTGVPGLFAHFKDRAKARHDERLGRVVEQSERIQQAISADLSRIARDHDITESVQLAAASRDTYLRALHEARLPLSNRWATTRAQAETRLTDSIPAQLAAIQLRAHNEATTRKRTVIRGCETAGPYRSLIHWATMKAALRWGGTWSGAHHLDLPGELAEALLPALFKGWRQLAHDVAILLSQYTASAEELLKSLDEAAASAARVAGLNPNDAAIADARLKLKQNLETAVTTLNSHVDKLNNEVPTKLRAVLKNHFEAECASVLKKNPQYGMPNYTRRLLQGYDDIGEAAIEKAAADGVKVLHVSLMDLQRQINNTLFKSDPVSVAYGRLESGMHDASESPDIIEARQNLVMWATSNFSWAADVETRG